MSHAGITHGTRLAQHAPLVAILAGACLLAFGRKLFWLFVGISGFLAGVFLIERIFGGGSQLVTLVAGIVAGLLGAALAIFLQRLAVGIAGFFAGGYLALDIANILGWLQPPMIWIAFLVGGIVGGILVVGLFDWALILLSSLLGASLIAEAFPSAGSLGALLFVVLCIAGIAIQGGLLRGDRLRVRE